ncbi:hypothetical protein SELMODRAFT_431962 [Selaginella moellendorffii]|uniref:RRM domain-containing protein n=1 Tax=Selaginella moellendorffii TaxID=88036 RepID=D8TEI2_SELML|nr:hypothetical protein SELMODRAFT_431962 [Selaginella moellendorffii]
MTGVTMVTTRRKRPSRKSKVVLSIVLLMKNVTGRLFVRNLAYTTSEEELVSLFGQYGEVVQVHLICDKCCVHATRSSNERSFHEPETREGGGSARKRSLAAIRKHGILARLYGGQAMGSPDQGVKPCGGAGGDHALLVKNLPFSTTESEKVLELPLTKTVAIVCDKKAIRNWSIPVNGFRLTRPSVSAKEMQGGSAVISCSEEQQQHAPKHVRPPVNPAAWPLGRQAQARKKDDGRSCVVIPGDATQHGDEQIQDPFVRTRSVGAGKFEGLRLAISPSSHS